MSGDSHALAATQVPYISYQRVCCYLSTILARCGSTALAAALPPYEKARTTTAVACPVGQ